MLKKKKTTYATIHVTNFVATCNECPWFSCGGNPTFDAATEHAIKSKHTVHIAITTHSSIYGIPKTS
jgi:hypothetical protein